EALEALNHNLKRSYTAKSLPEYPVDPWPERPTQLHKAWWEARIARQKEIDASIAARAEYETLYDKPYEERSKVRVAGPFTVESLSPVRMVGWDEDEEMHDPVGRARALEAPNQGFADMVLENLRRAGVQQTTKEGKIDFETLTPWPGEMLCAEGVYREGGEGGPPRRAGILVGPEFGTLTRGDLVQAAREAGDAGFDVLITCAFAYEAHTTDFGKLGRIAILKARMSAELHMADTLKSTGAGNLFVVFGEPDIDLEPVGGQWRVRIAGINIYDPATGQTRHSIPDDIACWFLDTDYSEESFMVRHAYFMGANDPYESLKRSLKAEIDADAWESLRSDTSRPFDAPTGGRIAVKVINCLGDEVMKVMRIPAGR
ncbi:MAG: site-specific DNA-methyltransferase, partial [Armatimonadetes bacterium]|nr:site-specific DNA-methyltransferase [Armatimonadota bacterium]